MSNCSGFVMMMMTMMMMMVVEEEEAVVVCVCVYVQAHTRWQANRRRFNNPTHP